MANHQAPPPEDDAANQASKGLPQVSPDVMEEALGEDIDNIVPTRGYHMIPMVALGGSAGSVMALQRFFEQMPADSGIVFVVILHLSPEFESTMPELLGRTTSMPVMAAKDGMKVAANSVYVIPPAKHLTTVNGHLRLDDFEPERGKRVAVDLFFRSLADTHGPHAAAIVLSGADADGSIGIKRIKERGGLTIAQDPDEAEHGGMPRSAIGTGMVDWVLRVAEMPERLLQYFAHEHKVKLPAEEGPQPAQPVKARAKDEDEAALRDILLFLRARTGRDFSYYKRATIVRRISRRLQINGIEDLPAYLTFLRTHQGEAGALLQDLLISVTNFFRDREAFAALEKQIPALFHDKTAEDTLRVWTPACATGEETYSIAMLLLEHARTLESPPALQVFGCDLDDDAIQSARSGAYPETIAADVSEERLRRFFTKEHSGYRVRREVREIVLFAQHDLLKDAPFSRLDLISCRNLLIYLNRDAQRRVMDIFHFALRPQSLLFLGSSESVEDDSRLFETIDKKHRLYRQRPAHRAGLPVPAGPGTLVRALDAQERAKGVPVLPGRGFGLAGGSPFGSDRGRGDDGLPVSELHYRLVERLGPPSVVVNGEYDVMHLSESAGRFLQLAGGEPSRNLVRMVHPMLRAELHAALHQAAESGQTVEALRVPFEVAGSVAAVNVRVHPANELAPNYLLVLFESVEPPAEASGETRGVARAEPQPVVRQLEREIETLRARSRDTAEQYEASTEELKASNEELQAMNEELRSASEELETSREELQSINEELTTVNQELKNKVDELAHTNSDLHNLMNATAIATIFLDRALRITRYTPSAVEIFRLIPTDVGRPLADLTRLIDYPDLEADAARVIEHLTPVEREVGDHGKWFMVRLLPYRTVDDRIAGAVLTFVDVTERKRAEEDNAADLAATTLLNELAARMVTEGNQRRIYEEILSAAIKLTAADAGTVQIYDPATHELVLLVTRGFERKMTDHFHRVNAASRTACGEALRTGSRTFIDFDDQTDEACRMHIEAGYRAAQATPLVSRSGTPIGMLNTHWHAPHHRPTARQLRFLDLLARQAADLIEHRQVQESLRLNEHRLRTMAENLPGGAVFIVDRDLRFQLAAGQALAVTGLKSEDFLGRTVEDAFSSALGPARAAAHAANFRRALGGESFTDTHQTHDREFETRGVPLRDAGNVVGVLAVSFDVTDRRHAEAAVGAAKAELEHRVRARTAEVQALFQRLISAEEQERSRIARNIHDQLGQQMTALRMNIEALRLKAEDNPALKAQAERTQALGDELDQSIDALTWELRPSALDNLGLAAALQHLLATWSKRFSIAGEFQMSGDSRRLPPAVEANMYRLVQEALHNVVKHAEATHVTVVMTSRDDETVLVIEDNGRGFEQPADDGPAGLGLVSMRERATLAGGTLAIESRRGGGTAIFARIPNPPATPE